MLPLTFKVATEPWEFEQIHRLNYRTFVEEIPQHPPNAERRLVDKFHHENTYIVCLAGRQLIGMLAMRAERPVLLRRSRQRQQVQRPKERQTQTLPHKPRSWSSLCPGRTMLP